MAKLSVIIPSRDERFLTPTIDDIFAHAEGEIEVVAVLDSEKWPGDWKEVSDRHPNLHTIHNGTSCGMRYSINAGVASAVSRGAKYVMKLDGHCSLSQGFDEALKKDCDKDWVVVPRRGRLDPENWVASDTHKPDIDYHYLSFPNDPNDFGGPGLNGKVWDERATQRKDILVDDEMSSQGSCWFIHADYFQYLELMDETHYGPFWNEMQEIACKAWLSGGQVKVNKNAKYLHLHKGKKYGRGYRLPESALIQGRDHTMKWPWNEAWDLQTKPFSWLIEHFWPVPSWPDNWEEILYATRKPRVISTAVLRDRTSDSACDNNGGNDSSQGLKIHEARYGIGTFEDIDVTRHLQSLVKDDSLDIIVNNSTLTPGQNPFRGKRKQLTVMYSLDGGEIVTRTVAEKDWLIIGPVQERLTEEQQRTIQVAGGPLASRIGVFKPLRPEQAIRVDSEKLAALPDGVIVGETISGRVDVLPKAPTTAPALNDYLIRKFQISPQRLRGPMPIELRDFHRNDLAQLFAELGFKRGAEIGVAEGHYSEVLLKANPELELLLVDPWHHYSDNPQGKSKEKHEFAYRETLRKTKPYKNVIIDARYSMDAVRNIKDESLDFCYIDAHHSYPWVMVDIIEWAKKVRSGGVVAGDDIFKLNEGRWGAGPMEAIFDYTRAMRISPWWLIDAPRSVDFFFVRT